MQPQPPESVGKVAFRHGMNFGLLQVFFATVILITNTFINTNVGLAFLLSTLSFLLSLAVYFVAGILAVKQTGRLRAGIYAGLWTGTIYGVINLAISLVIFFAVTYPRLLAGAANSVNALANPEAYRAGLMIGGMSVTIFGALLAVGFGAGLGVLGGLIGRNISPFRPVPVAPPYFPYPPQAYPGQPIPYAPLPPMQNAPAFPPMPAQPAPAEQIVPFTPPDPGQPG